jgi:phage repressor protein C with HTH and peptisase S24 domain
VTPETKAEADRLRQLWETRPGEKLNQTVFGERFDIGNQSAVGQFINGRTPLSLKAARGFVVGLNAAGHRITLEDISPRLQKIASSLAEVAPVEDDVFVGVPRKKVVLSAGAGRQAHLVEEVGRLKFRADFLRSVGANPQTAAVVDVAGQSMYPTIPDGAVVLVSGALREPRDRLIYGLRIGDDLFVKRLVRTAEGGWVARSDNEDRAVYPDIPLAGDDIELIGRAVWMGTRL